MHGIGLKAAETRRPTAAATFGEITSCQDVVGCLADLAILLLALGRAGGVRGKGFFEGCMRACGAAEIGRTRETA